MLLVSWYLFAAIQLIFWMVVFARFAFYRNFIDKENKEEVESTPISVIICARNEAKNLTRNLVAILEQDYPIFEVIVVNDASDDDTLSVLLHYQKKYPELQIIDIKQKVNHGKKAALTKGILAAKYDWVLLTDADCHPTGIHWILSMRKAIYRQKNAKEIQIVLGYGPYRTTTKWVNKWVQYETIYVAIQYFSLALWRKPYMGVGRNLMYRKELFVQQNGFEEHASVMSGDDDLFINAVATRNNTAICLHSDSFMYSAAPASWRGLYRQKTRHYSSSGHYKWYFQLILGLLALSHFGFYVGLAGLFWANIWNNAILFLIMIRFIVMYKVWLKSTQKLHETKILPYLWLMDLALPIYYLIFAIATLNYPNKKWK